ncbi:uncharacterized protein LOC115095764 isoform X3 [Rhinatrema bivittatum]|uniref:uncharacterized protein LOC115095764 isoform X3 n=1 Tax=Rhinatrema bivittatum TaxID=194408 RepID=UPI0011265775|nr:uncharacterized protein LOC115095764 isoform X3 [Rhinatrema bivittatum]
MGSKEATVAVTTANSDEEEEEAAGNGMLAGELTAGDSPGRAKRSSLIPMGPEETPQGTEAVKKCTCPGLGLIYTLLSSGFFSVSSLLVKKIEAIHSVEISAIRCIFQLLFVLPALIYCKYVSNMQKLDFWDQKVSEFSFSSGDYLVPVQ